MASTGKKGKKMKGRTVALTEFLGDSGAGSGSVKLCTSWAAEMEKCERSVMTVNLPSAPRSSRGPDISEERIPTTPPFTAHLTNLSYDVEEADLRNFFSRLKIANIKLLRENNDPEGRIKGTGYVEFQDRSSLIEALTMSGNLLLNRAVLIDLSSACGEGDHRRRNRQDYRNNRYDSSEDNTASNWRSRPSRTSPSPPPQSNDRNDSRGGYGSKYGRYDSGYSRDRRRGESNNDSRSFRNDRSDDRRGYGRDGFRGDRDGGYRRDNFRRDDFKRRDEFRRDDYRRDDQRREDSKRDDRWRDDPRGNSDRGYNRDDRRGDSRRDDNSRDFQRHENDEKRDGPPRTGRVKLSLIKRSVDAPPASESTASSAIFGGAKPVDTAKKEMEIEEKLIKSRESASKESISVNRPTPSSSIFGNAKPVDTAAREREIEERLMKMELEKGQLDEGEGEKKTYRGDKTHDHNSGVRSNEKGYSKNIKRDRSPSPIKAKDEDQTPSFVGSNKFSTLQAEDGSDKESE